MSLYVYAKWFCNADCADQDPNSKNMNKLYEEGIEFYNKKNSDSEDDSGELDDDFELWLKKIDNILIIN